MTALVLAGTVGVEEAADVAVSQFMQFINAPSLNCVSGEVSINRLARMFVQGTALALVLLAPMPIAARQGDCAQPVSDGAFPVSADCLFVLQAAVGGATCSPRCICDVNGSGGAPNASDALTCLGAAIGITVTLACPCQSPTTTTTLPTSGKWDIVFALGDSPTLSRLVVYVGYGEADGQFSGTGNDVACDPLLSADFIQLYDEETARELGLIFIDNGFAGPASFARCVFEAANKPSADSFSFNYYEALEPDFTPVSVRVYIESITPH